MPENPEIVAGLKTALERGYSLEFAKQSFINAGYSPQDVEDSSRTLNSGIISTIQAQPHQPPTQPQITQPQVTHLITQPKFQPTPQIIQPQGQIQLQEKKPEKPRKSTSIFVIILLAVILLLLIGALLITIFKREWITSLLESLGLM